MSHEDFVVNVCCAEPHDFEDNGLADGSPKCYNLGHANGTRHVDAARGGTVAGRELCDCKAVDPERQAEDGTDAGRTSSFAGGGAAAVSNEGQDEAGG